MYLLGSNFYGFAIHFFFWVVSVHPDAVGWAAAMNLYNDQSIDSSGESL
jgi:hypothetical protein